MSYYVAFPLLLLVALIEAAVLPYFRVSGLQPNLMLVLLTCWLMLRGQTEGFVLISAGGILLGLVDAAPMGTALLALAPLAFVHEIRAANLNESGLLLTMLFVAIMTVVYNLIYLLVFTLAGESGNWLAALTRVAIPTAILNIFAMLPIYWALWLSSHQMRRPTYV